MRIDRLRTHRSRSTAAASLGVLLAASALLALACTAPPAAPAAPATGAATAAPKGAEAPKVQRVEPRGRFAFGRGASSLAAFDTGNMNSSEGLGFAWQAFDGLGWLDANGVLQPGLAKSWKTIDDRTWEFELGDWTFQNGRPVTSDDAIATYERTRDPANRLIGFAAFAAVDRFERISDKTFRVHTKTVDPTTPRLLSLIMILPWREFQAAGSPARFFEAPIGTGPFKLTKADFRDELTYTAMGPDFKSPRGTPFVKDVAIKIILESGAREAAFRTGVLQGVGVPQDVVNNLEREGFKITRTSGSAATSVLLDPNDGPTRDRRVRQAINYAVDKEAILRALYAGNGRVDNQMLGTNVVGYYREGITYNYDLPRAQQLMREAGFPNGFRTTFTTVPAIESIGNEVAQAIQSYLVRIGIQAEIDGKDNAAWLAAYQGPREARRGLFFQVINWEQTFEANSVYRWFSSDVPVNAGRRWDHEEFDRLYQQAKATLDDRRRGELYAQAAKIINEEAPVLFLWQRFAPIVLARNVTWNTPGFADSYITQLRVD